MSALIEMPGKGIARRSSKGDAARVVIRETLAEFLGPLASAKDYATRWEATAGTISGKVWLGDGPIEPLVPHLLETAKRVHGEWLRHYADIVQLGRVLLNILMGPKPIDEESAMQMMLRLFASLGKRKSDPENAKLLNASVDMLSPLNQQMGSVTGLWEPINTHRLIVALAVEKIIATEKFTSTAELREAMEEATRAVGFYYRDIGEITAAIERADAIVFLGDQAAWNAAYEQVDDKVIAAMQRHLKYKEDPYLDDDGVDQPGTPRWSALTAIVESKKLGAPEPKQKRLAAASKRRSEAKRSSRAR
jgi:hypothetical protein